MKLRLLAIIFSTFIYLLFASSSNAETSNYPIITNPDVPQNYHTYTQSVILELAAALSCQISGIDPINPNAKCLGIDPNTGRIGYVNSGGGLIGITGNSIASMFQIPVSSTHYAKYLADNFGIAKNTYAQEGEEFFESGEGGVGFSGLSKLLPIWKVFRNLVYMLFIFIFVIIGVGIMFRIKIDPRTVMTIQNQIPKIIIALVLVTFSYAISGFLIDFMYVFLYLIYNTFASANLIDVSGLAPAKIQGSTPLSAIGFTGGLSIAGNAAYGIGSILASLFNGGIGGTIASIIGALITGPAGVVLSVGSLIGIGPGTGGIGRAAIGTIGGIVAFLVIAAALLVALFRLWFQLIKTYISILINITLAPFWIAGGLIPNSPVSFSAWMRDMVGNLASYPVVLFMLLIGKVFIDEFGSGDTSNFVPPFIGNPGNAKSFGALIGLGIILLTPNAVNLVRQAIKAPQGKTTAAIGQALSTGGAVLGAPASKFGGKLWGQDPYSKEYKPLTKALRAGTGRLAQGRWLGVIGRPLDKVAKFALGESSGEWEGRRLRAQREGRRLAGVPPEEEEGDGRGGTGTPPTTPPPAGGGGGTTPPTTPPGGGTP